MAEVGGGVEVEWTPVLPLVLMAIFVFWPNSRRYLLAINNYCGGGKRSLSRLLEFPR
jgi:hypothetical protein